MNTAAKITPEQVVDAMRIESAKPGEHTVPPFPLDVLPDLLADYARELQRCNGFPPDYTGSAFIYAASVCIGNAFHVKVKEGYTMPGVLWLALVGKPGTVKSHPLDLALNHLKIRDADAFDKYREEVMIWEHEQAERKRSGAQDTEAATPKPRPHWSLHLVTDATMEALMGKLEHLPRGVGLHRDELSGWWGSMDQYRKGADREKWLSLYNGKQVDAIRKTSGEVLVRRPFVSVAGTVQPDKLYTLGKEQDGFLPRLLFAYPDEQAKPYHTTAEVSPDWAAGYASLVDRLLEIPMAEHEGKLVPRLLPLSAEAVALFLAWDRMNTDRTNAAEADGIAGIYPKLEMYVHRLALLLELLHVVCDGSGTGESIGADAMEGALKLVEYFEATARKVHFQLFEADAVDRLPPLKARIYAALPERFATGEGIKIAKAMGMPPTTFKRLLREPKLFRKDSHGVNLKLMES